MNVHPDPKAPVDLSVVIVNWNARKDLSRCLEALPRACSELATEILVVDNDSSDGSLDMVATDFPQARGLASGANLGFAGGINFGIRHSQGRWIATLNPDVFPCDDSLRILVDTLDESPRRALAGPRILDDKGCAITQDFSLPGVVAALRRLPGVPWFLRSLRRILHIPLPTGPRRVERVNGCFMLFRRTALEAIGGFPEITFLYGEEIAIGGSFRAAGFEVWYQPHAEVVHRDGSSVEQLWTDEERRLVFRAARLLTGRELLNGTSFVLWVLVFLCGELLYSALGPLARGLGRPWPRLPLRESLSLHVVALRSVFQPSFKDKLRERYHRYTAQQSAAS